MTTMTETATTTQVYQVFIKATPEQIWEAITKPDFTERYFYGVAGEFDLRPGGIYNGLAGSTSRSCSSTARSSSPTRRGGSSTRGARSTTRRPRPSRTSRVSWEIEPQDGGFTKLTVVHDRLEEAPKTALSVAGGWSFVLSGLKTLLETGKPLAG